MIKVIIGRQKINLNMKLYNSRSLDFQKKGKFTKEKALKIHKCVRDAITDNGFVFFGGYATYLYSRYKR